MALSEKILQILACPQCKGGLQFRADKPSLDCTFCQLSYPIRDDIPVMLVAEAESINRKIEA